MPFKGKSLEALAGMRIMGSKKLGPRLEAFAGRGWLG
jgi:hypothetical protein